MTTQEASTSTLHPIRELVWPEIERPIQRLDPENERRRYHRYARRGLPAALTVADQTHPVSCVDIGYGGMQVLAPNSAAIRPGQRVVVRVQQYTRTFQDELSVRHCQRMPNWTAVHLAL